MARLLLWSKSRLSYGRNQPDLVLPESRQNYYSFLVHRQMPFALLSGQRQLHLYDQSYLCFTLEHVTSL